MPTIAERLFDASAAEGDLEEALDAAGIKYEKLGWDDYDCSLEIYGAMPDQRLNEQMQKAIYDAGFCTVFVNHTDKWETHYSFKRQDGFSPKEGWRVSYPHKRDDEDGSILVEKVVPRWPAEWFESGKVKVTT